MAVASEHDTLYWQYEYEVTTKYLIPLLERWNVRADDSSSLLDVGCAYGGCASAFVDAGWEGKGFDIASEWVDIANSLKGNRDLELKVGSIYDNPPPFSKERFDLVVLRDVFEHLEQKERALAVLKSYLKPDGKIVMTFPPFYSSYGGHQQALRSKFAKLPFLHLVPGMATYFFPKLNGENPDVIAEIQKLCRLKMGIRKFEKLLPPAGLSIVAMQAYLISPNHTRFGLSPIGGNILARIPAVKEVLISGVIYLLSIK
jgi:SAM-dependent methyltransferase